MKHFLNEVIKNLNCRHITIMNMSFVSTPSDFVCIQITFAEISNTVHVCTLFENVCLYMDVNFSI